MRKVLYILGQLEDRDLQWLLDAGEPRRVAAGEVLIHEGRPLESVFILIEGELVVSKAGAELARLGAGEVVGEMSFLDSRPPSATVAADAGATVFTVPRELLRSKLRADVAFAARFYRALSVFLANRLDRTDALIGQARRVAPELDAQDGDELSPEAMDSTLLAGARFNWFLERVRAR